MRRGCGGGRAEGWVGCTPGTATDCGMCMRARRGSEQRGWAAAVGERYGRMAVRAGRADRWDKGVKAAERLGRIGAMWLGAACACVRVTRGGMGWRLVGCAERRLVGVCGVVSRMAMGGMRDVGWWCGVLVCGDGSMWTWGW